MVVISGGLVEPQERGGGTCAHCNDQVSCFLSYII
jgi:hypothetical protein